MQHMLCDCPGLKERLLKWPGELKRCFFAKSWKPFKDVGIVLGFPGRVFSSICVSRLIFLSSGFVIDLMPSDCSRRSLSEQGQK